MDRLNWPMKQLPKNFCVAPFIQCTTHPSGSFSPCPYLGGTTWATSKQSIIKQWTSDDLESLRNEFINNRQSEICSRCWHEEQNQKQSLRLRLFDPVNHTSDYSFINAKTFADRIVNNVNNKSYLLGPEVLTIKNGNICNAKCRVCHPGDSSRWIEDAKKLFNITGKTYYSLEQQERNWSDEQIEEIVKLASNLKRLELFGGEPTYNKQVTRLLERLVVEGHSKHIILYINTNGGVDISARWPFVKEFEQIEVGVSLDGVGVQFEYQRHGLNYQVVIDNVCKLQNYLSINNVKHSIDSISTVNILNVYYLPELKQEVLKILPLAPFWNLLVDPAHLFIKNMPDYVKNAVIEKLKSDSEFDELISIMQQPADLDHWHTFLEINHALDSIRNESFRLTFPEFFNIINTN